MGAYRVVLALMVALSHIGVTVLGVNLGISAVISFYLLSGFVMTALVERHYPTPGRVGLFYIDRLVRLYPQFLFYLFATLALVFVARPKSGYLADITPFKVALNALIAPLNFYWLWVRNATLIPQA
jgi:peptidoglycan/LPS O-acetylase OafA/YrhL